MARQICLFLIASLFLISCTKEDKPYLLLHKDAHIILIGNNLCARMMNYGHFETALHLRFPDSSLYIRNMCDGGDTPAFRPRSGLENPWTFEGAPVYQPDFTRNSGNIGQLESADDWLTQHKADVILAFFGFPESYKGEAGISLFKNELAAFIQHTLAQQYNGKNAPQLALVSPTAFEDLSNQYDLPDGSKENKNLALYTQAMQEVAAEQGVYFVDVFTPTQEWFASADNYTIDGLQLTDAAYEQFGDYLANELFGKEKMKAKPHKKAIHAAVQEKNWMWHNDYKIPNGVHVFGRRFDPFGPDNYPFELKKIRAMTAIRDQAIWATAQANDFDITAADAKTDSLPAVETNYKLGDYGRGKERYLYGEDALATFEVADGFQLELFASEQEFPDLANPVQLSFDNKGRLWVATMPSYPHYRPGDEKPNDKLLILEDTDKDGKADKQTIFADGLHLPTGFELTHEGVFCTQGTNLVLLKDSNGDDKADSKEIILSGFDDHDTHHVISAYCADPSGAIYMAEGVFLHTNVETPYGTVRATNGGFMRYNPARKRLERTAQLPIPNPWGIAFDEWGQPFFAETSGPDVRWMLPGTVKSLYGVSHCKSKNIIEEAHKVRPTSGLEFVSSRHFPDEMQGDMLINNAIGFLGTKQHQMLDDTSGYLSKFRQDLAKSSDGNYRPVDLEFAPDGSLYIVDWHNVLVGHMQHNARDPLRDHQHGRIYRITYPSRPLVGPAEIAGASIATLLNNLKLPEYRTRYRTRRELRGRAASAVTTALQTWVADLDKKDTQHEHHLLEALWVYWGMNEVNEDLLHQLLASKNYHIRAAAARVVRYMGHRLENRIDLLRQIAKDAHGRVQIEAITAASWLHKQDGLEVLAAVNEENMDSEVAATFNTAKAHLNGYSITEDPKKITAAHLEGEALEQFKRGLELYHQDGSCVTCHQANGKGLGASGFPPLVGTKWVNGSEERLIKLVLHGLYGPMEVLGEPYPGRVPMTPYGNLMNDAEIADVLTFVRNSFTNKSSPISAEQVTAVRAATADKEVFYRPEELLAAHPLEN